MERALEILAVNAILAAGLAALVAILSRRLRHAPLVHALWVLVLVKFLAPALVPIGSVLPARVVERGEELLRGEAPAAGETTSFPRPFPEGNDPGGVVARPAEGTKRARPDSPAVTPPPSRAATVPPPMALFAIQLAGTVGVLAFALRRMRRFRRALRAGRPAGRELRQRVEALAARLGVAPAPAVVRLDAPVSPLVWWSGGRPTLVMPEGLIATLAPAELDAVLAHELAHVRRRDHWVRLLELAATAVFWWHPVVWWARRRLHRAEELACDHLVLQSLPHRPRAYADGLLKTLEFLSRLSRPVPALATGIGATRNLEERLVMIMGPRPLKRPTPLVRGLLLGTAVLVILVSPGRLLGKVATREAHPAAPAVPTVSVAPLPAPPTPLAMIEPPTIPLPPLAPEVPLPFLSRRATVRLAEAVRLAAAAVPRSVPDDAVAELLALRGTQLDLEEQLRRLGLERQRLEMRIRDVETARAVAELREALETAEANGEREEAEQLRQHLQEMERTADLQARRAQFEFEMQEQQAESRSALERQAILHEKLLAEEKLDEAERVEVQMRRAELELEALETNAMERELDLQREELEARRAFRQAQEKYLSERERKRAD